MNADKIVHIFHLYLLDKLEENMAKIFKIKFIDNGKIGQIIADQVSRLKEANNRALDK